MEPEFVDCAVPLALKQEPQEVEDDRDPMGEEEYIIGKDQIKKEEEHVLIQPDIQDMELFEVEEMKIEPLDDKIEQIKCSDVGETSSIKNESAEPSTNTCLAGEHDQRMSHGSSDVNCSDTPPEIENNHPNIDNTVSGEGQPNDLLPSNQKPTRKEHKCSNCGQAFPYRSGLLAHMGKHTAQSYKCKKCDETFTTAGKRNYHQHAHHEGKTDNRYICEDCGVRCSSFSALTIHRRRHTGERPFPCRLCSYAFVNLGGLEQHMVSHTGYKAFKCEVCDKSFTKSGNLTSHRRIHTGEKPYKCDICSHATKDLAGLKYHVLSVHRGERPFACDLCDKNFVTRSGYREHRNSHLDDTIYKCHLCEYSTKRKINLKKHMKNQHLTEKMFQCKVCDKSFVSEYNLSEHELTHTVEKLHKCEECDFATNHPSYLKRHVNLKHLRSAAPFKCEICGKELYRLSHLKGHMRTHTGERPFKCSLCDYAGTEPSCLKLHMMKHNGERPYKCEICQKAFTTAQYLKSHQEHVHFDARPFQCPQCEYRAKSKSHMTKHVAKVHKNARPHKCEQCGKGFYGASVLADHVRIHTGEKPYECELCEYASAHRAGLRNHIAKKHKGEWAHVCGPCGITFLDSEGLAKHRSTCSQLSNS